jgi:type I restriction enzyme, S subunit
VILSELCEFIVDSEHKTAPTQETGHPMIRTPNLGRGVFLLDGVRRVSAETYEAWTRRGKPKYGDIILAREAPVGNVAMVPRGIKPCLGQRTVLIRPKHSEIDAKYLSFLIVGDEIQSRIHGMSSGATVAHLNMKDIRNLELPPLPLLPTQCKIASILSAYDDLIENNTRRIAILEEMAKAIYREWFVNFRFLGHENVKLVDAPLGQVPEGWEVQTFDDIATFENGDRGKNYPKSSGFVDEGIPFVNAGHLVDGIVKPREVNRIDEATFDRLSRGKIKEDDLLMCVRGSIGRVARVGSLCLGAIASSLVIIRESAPFSKAYLYYTLSGPSGQQMVAELNNGVAQPNVSVQAVKRYRILVPSHPVLKQFEEFVDPIWKEGTLLHAKCDNLRITRDLLLPKLISGKLDVEDLDIDMGEPIEQLEEATA